jgi:hypothetical protein
MTGGMQFAESWIPTALGYTVDFDWLDTSGLEYIAPMKFLRQLYEVACKVLEHIYMHMNTRQKISFPFIK